MVQANCWGKLLLANGDVYEGNYVKGKREGEGTYKFKVFIMFYVF